MHIVAFGESSVLTPFTVSSGHVLVRWTEKGQPLGQDTVAAGRQPSARVARRQPPRGFASGELRQPAVLVSLEHTELQVPPEADHWAPASTVREVEIGARVGHRPTAPSPRKPQRAAARQAGGVLNARAAARNLDSGSHACQRITFERHDIDETSSPLFSSWVYDAA